jgi:hypothetical protein
VFARTSGEPGQALGITAFLVPCDTPGFEVPFYWWTFNMPSDHGEVELRDVRIPADAVLGEVGRGLEVAQTFLHENRIRQAASSLGAAQYCIDRAVEYASHRVTFGKPLAVNQAIQWPLVELQTEAQMVRLLVYYAAWELDRNHHLEVSDKVSMANYRANRLVCEAADLPVKRLCQDVLAAEVTAMGATAIIAADSATPGQRPMAEAQLAAARAAGARSILSTAISPDATAVNSGPSVGVGLGGYTGSGGWGSGSGVGVGVGFSLPVGGGQVQQALGATGALTNVASGKTMWTVRSSATPSGNMNAQVSQLGKSIVSAAQRAGFF